jgi:hypothetical protein
MDLMRMLLPVPQKIGRSPKALGNAVRFTYF